MPTATYSLPGAYYYWTVPAGVTSVSVALEGGGSGTVNGGHVSGRLAVTPGRRLTLIVGEAGKANSGASGGGYAWGGGAPGGDAKSGTGGDGGGGYTAIRRDSSTGTVVAVAGGAGGKSGDNGAGGLGGGSTGGSGARGTSGSNSTANATGGTQNQGGNGGTSSSGAEFNGANTSNVAMTSAGAGGSADHTSHGGGGGGGGWHPGGGGQAASTGYAPGGGGGGGSSYVGGLTGYTIGVPGNGSTGNGKIIISWTTPAPANLPPTPPTSVLINGVAEAEALPTKATTVTVSALLNDPDAGNQVQMLVRISANDFKTYVDFWTPYVNRGLRASVKLPTLTPGYLYKARLYAKDKGGLYSGYNTISFWSDRPPSPPELTAPKENARVPSISSTVFAWTHIDPDPTDPQKGFELRWRTAGRNFGGHPPGAWTTLSHPTTAQSTWTVDPNTFKGNTNYEWSVRTRDQLGVWGEWAVPFSLFASSTATPPNLLTPAEGTAVDVTAPRTFTWRFIDPDPGDSQSRADFRYRVVGQPDTLWITLFGAVDPGVPGKVLAWTLPAGTFAAGMHYEWSVRTYDSIGGGSVSDWSYPATFWAIDSPGIGSIPPPADVSDFPQGALGCGTYRVYIYEQGGTRAIGEITPLTSLNFKRVRDDISGALLSSNGFGQDCCALYASLRSWMHEVVVFRDGVRVWEGPITRIAYMVDHVEIEAKDVMAYLYRRIMRQGYDDSYQKQKGEQPLDEGGIRLGSPTVVDRAYRIIVDAFAPHDPNILPYLTAYRFDDDARESRVIPDYSQTAWEQVDDLAATAGLDYTVVGRRIILWDTHRMIGRLPEMRDGDFSDPPVVTEYGMQMANYFAVTNGSGVWGAATPLDETSPGQSYGPIEMLASAYGEAEGGAAEVLTAAARQDLITTLEGQAQRNIDDRWPTPLVVRVPDNSTLSPDVEVGFDQLVPGVWVPLRSSATCRVVEQWQKLDSVTVDYDATGEKVQVVMSPAPHGGRDPDLDNSETEGA